MISILLTILTVLFYAGLCYLVLLLVLWITERIFGPIDPKIKQVAIGLVLLACIIWIISVLALGAPVPAPWSIRR